MITTSFSFAQKSTISVVKTKQSFKKVAEGKIVRLTYQINHLENEALIMQLPKVDCTCTEVELNDNLLYPNKTNELVVIFNTEGKMGYQEREIELVFFSKEKNETYTRKIVFKGVVKASKKTKEAYKQKQN